MAKLETITVGEQTFEIGGGSDINISYSTDEQNTGLTWIDGKPIYQKTLTISHDGTENVTVSADISSLNIETPISLNGFGGKTRVEGNTYYVVPGSIWFTIPSEGRFPSDFGFTMITVNLQRQVVELRLGAGQGFNNITITITYTKTTDTPV